MATTVITIKQKQDEIKRQLLDTILFECNDKSLSEQARRRNCLKYIDKFANKLLPSETTVSGDKDGEAITIIVKKYAGD
jgi:hypothetical protein